MPFVRGDSACDPGTLTDAGRADALFAANYVRWLVGLTPLLGLQRRRRRTRTVR